MMTKISSKYGEALRFWQSVTTIVFFPVLSAGIMWVASSIVELDRRTAILEYEASKGARFTAEAGRAIELRLGQELDAVWREIEETKERIQFLERSPQP